MENASKALIIAGSILLAILLISLGMMVLNQGRDILNRNGMSQADINAFNSKFTQYEGTNIRGSVVRSLLQETIANNADETNIDAGRIVTIQEGGTTLVDATATNTRTIKNTATYTVEMTTYVKGCISVITITKN